MKNIYPVKTGSSGSRGSNIRNIHDSQAKLGSTVLLFGYIHVATGPKEMHVPIHPLTGANVVGATEVQPDRSPTG